MPRWPDQEGLAVRRLDGFATSGPRFTLAFDVGEPVDGEEVWLALDGIATAYAVTLNAAICYLNR